MATEAGPNAQLIDFALVNAFTRSPFGGNPAAIIYLDAPLAEDAYIPLARNFNQPMACFVLPPTRVSKEEVEAEQKAGVQKTFRTRWFTNEFEAPLCGHGTLATAYALFQNQIRADLVPQSVKLIRFETMHGHFDARRVPATKDVGERIEIEMPAFKAAPVTDAVFQSTSAIVARAFGRNIEEFGVKFVGVAAEGSSAGSDIYKLVEVDERALLDGSVVDGSKFLASVPQVVNILTCASSRPGIAYETRMFAPAAGVLEDHVCGSANCLMAPYWADKLGIPSLQEMHAKQVSLRGGDLWTVVDRERQKVLLRGEAILTAKGQLYL